MWHLTVPAINTELKNSCKEKKNTKLTCLRKSKTKLVIQIWNTAAIVHFRGIYQRYTLKRTTVNNWKRKFSNPQKEVGEPPEKFNKKGRPLLVGEEFLVKLKEAIIGIRLTGAVISRKMIISIGNGVLKANRPNSLSEIGGGITLTDNWARGVLKSMDWVKRKGTTRKVEPSAQFLAEEKFIFQRAISAVVCNHDMPADLAINLDQTRLSYVSPGKYTFNFKSAKNVPIKDVMTSIKLLLHLQSVQPVNFYQCN